MNLNSLCRLSLNHAGVQAGAHADGSLWVGGKATGEKYDLTQKDISLSIVIPFFLLVAQGMAHGSQLHAATL